MTTYKTADDVISSELPNGKVVTLLEILFDWTIKDAKAAVVDRGSKRSSGFAADFYDYLRSETPSEAEAIAFIKGTDGNFETSDNVQKHESHYMAIWLMVDGIRADFAEDSE